MPSEFELRKRKILEQLAVPDEEYSDLSPKGSIDAPIRTLIDEINGLNGIVTTSSCSGRISVFLEGKRKEDPAYEGTDEQGNTAASELAGPGGKGGGGNWLHVSHDPIQLPENPSSQHLMSLFNMSPRPAGDTTENREATRYVHLKFEPMILHILTASYEDAQRVLAAALASGFRESGAVGILPSKQGVVNPMVAVRCAGLSFDAVVGYQQLPGSYAALVDETYLRTLVCVANERFTINKERIERFRSALLQRYSDQENVYLPNTTQKEGWEDSESRRRRKRLEGLQKQQALQAAQASAAITTESSEAGDLVLDGMFG